MASLRGFMDAEHTALAFLGICQNGWISVPGAAETTLCYRLQLFVYVSATVGSQILRVGKELSSAISWVVGARFVEGVA